MKNKGKKRKHHEIVEEDEKPKPLPAVRHSDEPIQKKVEINTYFFFYKIN